MKTCALKTYTIALGTSVCFTFSALSYAVSSSASSLQQDTAIQAINAVTGSPVEFSRSEYTGQINYLSTDQSHPVPLFSSPDAGAEARALEFITTYGKSFGINTAKQVKTVKVSGKDEVGMEHVRLQQLHKGIPVTAGEMTVHLRGNSVVSVLSKTLSGLDNLDVTPHISPADAEKTVQELLEKLGIDNASLSKPKLEVFNKGLLQGGKQPAYLAWFIEAKKIDVREYVWVDAHRGAILLHFSQLAEARKRKIYDTFSSDTLPGTLVRSEGQNPTGDPDADKAYLFSGHTYDYFKNQHGRDSYDGLGATMISTVHYCDLTNFFCPYENAFWNGDQMVYGDGFSAADDVDAHELTHAVTENSARLYYYTQSGGLNESFSDIFGESVDLGNGAGNDTASVRWLMGEDVPGLGAIRNMKNPGAFNDPAKVNDVNYKCDINDGDQGGVHSNSGVPNHAYALMVDGGSFNGQNITGIGLAKAGKIEYRALTRYLTSGSTFLDDYNALQRSCTDLIGTSGITATNCTQVKNALNAVQMNASVCSKPVAPALCSAGAKVKPLFFDGLEASGGNFVSSDFNVWSIVQGYAKTGSLSMFVRSLDIPSDNNYKMTKNILIPAAGAKMQFDHAFDFEINSIGRHDGGVVEYSTDNGISWVDAGGLMSAGQKYNGKIYNGFNPLAGRSAFTADSFGYTATQLNLGALKGKNVRFRFRIGSDDGTVFVGWFIDNIQIYQCQ